MQDELLMRQWTALHEDFVAGLQNRGGRPGGSQQRDEPSFDMIEPAYRTRTPNSSRSAPSTLFSPAAQASISGFVASVVTALLWMTLMTLAMPASGLISAPEAPATRTASTLTYPTLA